MDATLDLLGVSTLIGAVLVMLSIVVGMMTSRAGTPLLLIFLGVGMLAGEDGIGQIQFDNHQLSFWVANIALAIILLDGGLRTPYATFRIALKPAIVLSTFGVLMTAVVLALSAWLIFDIPFGVAFLLGAIVSSTDAAAVFSLLKNSGVRLNERVESALEIESGVNDPMAVFLTLFAIMLLTTQPLPAAPELGLSMVVMLMKQAGFGIVVAYVCAHGFLRILRFAGGRATVNQGLNALFMASAGLATFGLATVLEGSGFLAIYIFGLVVGNRKGRFVKGIVPAMDGLAWLFQAGMFLLLGLLATPSALVNSLGTGITLALILMFVARPSAVFPSLYLFRFTFKEMLFISWVGLRGAVPIILAIFPIIAGVDDRKLMLDLALVVVILSLLFQGSTIPFLARRLGLALPPVSDTTAMRKLFGDFTLDGSAMAADAAAFYGVELPNAEGKSLGEWLQQELGKPAVEGDEITQGGLVFVVRSLEGDAIVKIGVRQVVGGQQV
jgi:cell volume regulation protein A